MFRKLAAFAAGVAMLGLSIAPASAGQVVPTISITKTVTTAPGVCGTSSSIQVAAGTTVYYCYTVTNNGPGDFDIHNLTDDVLGPILVDFAFSLAPGASVNTVTAGLTVDSVITENTLNVANWEACTDFSLEPDAFTPQGSGNICADATATALVTVIDAPTTTTTTTAEAPPAVAATGTPRFTG